MRNKFLAALLTLCMTSAMFPFSVSAEGNIPIADGQERVVEEVKEEEIYFSDGQSVRRIDREEWTEPEGRATGEAGNAAVQQKTQEVKELIQLPAPTDLTWGMRGTNTIIDAPGWMSWKIDYDADKGAAGRDCSVKIYREGETEPSATSSWSMGNEWERGLYYVPDFIIEDLDSGRYYFTVQWTGDGEEYSDSDVAESEVWEYQKPEAQLETSITKMEWDWPDFKWEYTGDILDAYGFDRKLLFSETEDGEPRVVGRAFGSNNTTDKIYDHTIQNCGKGYYYFMVRAISNDITKYQNGAWSELSPAYNLTEVTEGVADSLANILNNQENSSPSEIRQQIQEINRTDLRSSMLADENVLNQVQQLEDKMTDIKVGVDVKDSRLDDFPIDQVKILGAKLNTPEENAKKITLKIDEPEKEDLVIPGRYKNTLAVKFSMDIDGLDEAANRTLAVPVRITLPVPDNINPRRLSILHYSSGDTPECLESPFGIYTYQENDKWYVSFMVDHFSDFVMTEIMPAVVTFNADGGTCGTETLSVNEDNVLPEIPTATRRGYMFDGWYTTDGKKVDATTVFEEDTTVTAKWTKVSGSNSGSSSESGSEYNPPAIVTSVPSTPTVEPSVTPSGNETPTGTPTPSGNETPIVTPSVTPTDTPTAIPTNTPTATPTDTPSVTPTNTPSTSTIPKKGTILRFKNVTYKITQKGSEVSYIKTSSTAASVTIPATVKISGITYKVTSIASNAFKGNKRLSKITIGKNITSIEKNAFRGCKNLKTVTIKSKKLKSVGKNAFKGIKSNAKIKVPSKKQKAYIKLLKGKGQGKEVKITK